MLKENEPNHLHVFGDFIPVRLELKYYIWF